MCDYIYISGGCITVGGPNPGKSCIFPFTYNGIKRTSCAWDHWANSDWCQIEIPSNGSAIKRQGKLRGKWGVCGSGCNNLMTEEIKIYTRGKHECGKKIYQVLTRVNLLYAL
jgi:hypothetical protein